MLSPSEFTEVKSDHSKRSSRRNKLGCFSRFYRIDEKVLKPTLIYKYDKKKTKEVREMFHKLRENLG